MSQRLFMDPNLVQSINLARIVREGGTAEAKGEIHDTIRLDGEQILLEAPALWKVSVTSIGDGELWLSGEIAGKAVLECRRCLEAAPTLVRAHFHHMLRYQPGAEGLEVKEEDEEEFVVFGHPDLDLSVFLSEAFAVELPLAALCKQDCQGLCPVCGANRNQTDCGHPLSQEASKLAGLDKFLDEIK